ncbi:MAG: proline dehydrogenase [Chloroflexi bacterium]|nr:proline dehydrogenase [Chloroflexota bacterium]
MLKAFLIYLSKAAWAKRIVTHWQVARRVVLRFVAGETETDAIEAVRSINQNGMTATLDVLGESVTSVEDAQAAANAYLSLIDAIEQEGLRSWVSLKLTAFGLDIDSALCQRNLIAVLDRAKAAGVMVTIDMEDSPYTQTTLDLFRSLRQQGYENVRTVIQSYLLRSDDDVRQLAEEGAGIRLVKGAYREPADVAYARKKDVDSAFVRQMNNLLEAAKDGRGYPAIATHDDAIIDQGLNFAQKEQVPPACYEFQMLYGVRTTLQSDLLAQGYNVRVYVPFGTQWYPYFMRRLAERPANLWFFASNFFRR